MIVIVPDDFFRSVQLHGTAEDAEASIAWLETAIASIAAGDGSFSVQRRMAPDRYGFDETLVVVRKALDERPTEAFMVPLIDGWPLPGARRPDVGELPSHLAFVVIDRLVVHLRAMLPMPSDPVAEVVAHDRAVAIGIAALMACDHPDDGDEGDDELVFEGGERRLSIHADRLTGMPYVGMIDRHYSDDDIDPEDRLPAADLVEVCRRHVLALELRRDPDKEHFAGLTRLDMDDEHREGRIHSIVTSPFEALRMVGDIRAGSVA